MFVEFYFLTEMILTKSIIFCMFITVADCDNGINLRPGNVHRENCDVDHMLTPKGCTDADGKTTFTGESNVLPHNTSCVVRYGKDEWFNVSCRDGVLFISTVEEKSLMRIKRKAFTTAGAAIGSLFGPIGTAVGAGIGLIADIFCIFICNQNDPPPPNKPPSFSKPAVLLTATPIMAGEGKTTAKVTWEPPTVTDPEDGEIQVITSPSTFKNGSEFSEGNYVVYFVGTDSGGLSATGYLSFQVQVDRCGFPRWPENGVIDCVGSEVIYGTTCNVTCKTGYTLDEGDNKTLQCGKNGMWTPPVPPNCKPRACDKAPSIPHGVVQCLNNKQVYDNLCEAVCNDGFQVHGTRFMGCNTNGKWGSTPVCTDVFPPRFLFCPSDMQVYIDSTNNTAQVTWEEPEGDDNSEETVTITETHGYKSGQRFEAGSHTIKYTIEDKEQNRGDSCVFNVQVLTISCSPPNFNVTGGDHLKYECPNSYRLGAECSLACTSGYPKGGVDKIQCLSDKTSNPPKLDWKWEDGGLAPFCKETNCSRDALNEPINGALACSQWTHGQMCQMQCNDKYDIPNIGDSLFVCGRSTGKWRPSAKVPDCSEKIDVNNMNLPNEFYYFTGECNSSSENMNQIKENFVQALNTSKFLEECVGVPDCQAKYVDVTCGPVSYRRKREINFHIYRRSVSTFAYTVRFDFILPYTPNAGKSPEDIFMENEDLLYKMSNVIHKEVDSGHFDLDIGDLHVESDSYGPGTPSMQCPSGTIPRRESASCVGCPTGNHATLAGRCVECPIGTYQNSTNSLKCEPCPPNTNTTEIGAENITQCLRYCVAGEFSPNTLAPCTKCPSNSYQPNAQSVSCTRCESNKRSASDGATSKSQCQEYDIQLNDVKTQIENKKIYDVVTLFMWIYISNIKTNAAVEIENSATHLNFSLRFTPTISIEQSGNDVSTGNLVHQSTWTNLALSVDKPSSEVILYINGKTVYTNASFVVLKTHILEQNDLIGLYGDMKISAFTVLPRKVTPSDILSWSSTCSPSISGNILSMDDLAEAEGVRVVNPSVCDAVDECASSPCGTHECINKLGNYECVCSGGYTGRQCQLPPDYCKDNNCKNGASCVNGTGNYTCTCPYGYSGEICEIKAVDGEWSSWTNLTGCSQSCGGGISTRTRRCDSPPPDPEGKQCVGHSSETKSCKEEKCPECSKLRRTYGLIIGCNETSELQHCSISCRAGLYFTTPPLPYYECGVATGYKWNHQNEKNPTGRLPSCSELEPPSQIGLKFEGNYDSIPCTANNKQTVKSSIETKLSALDCSKAGTCETTIQEPVCTLSKKMKATGSSMTVTVRLNAPVNSKEGSFNVAGLLQNKSAPSQELADFVRQTLELEKSAQTLMNHSVDFFQVTVDGTKHSLTPGSSPLTYRPDTKCPSGMVRIEVFCAVCPVGSYSDGQTVTMCPIGQFQDTTGQSMCKRCPFGKSTAGIGSIYASECSVIDESSRAGSPANQDGVSNVVKICVGVSVSIALLVLAAVGVYLACKHFNKKKRTVYIRHNDSYLDLSGYYNISSKPVFEKQSLATDVF